MGAATGKPPREPREARRETGLLARIRHAFAVDPDGAAEPTAKQREAVDWFCRQVAKRHLTTPGLIALEMSRPLNYVGAQLLHFFGPGVWAIVKQQTYEQYQQFAEFLEQRGSLEYMARRIEDLEAQFDREARARRDAAGRRTDETTEQSRP